MSAAPEIGFEQSAPMSAIRAADILEALIAYSAEKIWATELALMSGSRRVDFWTLEVAASRGFRACAYEIKVTRADFRRDSEEKQDGALRYSDRFWYVTPPSLLRRDEVPLWAGLQEWDGKLLTVKKKAPRRERADPDWEFVVSLLRNSGDCRRDVGLLKAQLSFLQHRLDEQERIAKLSERRHFQRFLRRGTAREASK